MRGEQIAGCALLQGRRSEGLSAAQVSIRWPVAPGVEMGELGSAELGSCGDSGGLHGPTLLLGLHGCPQWGEEEGSEHPLKQDRFQHFPFCGAHKPEFKVHDNLDTSILAADGSGFGLKARGELKISCS